MAAQSEDLWPCARKRLTGLTMALWWAVLGLVVVACSTRIPHPSYTAQTTDALVEVDYPPPPARVEFVPEPPDKKAVWVNGEWAWTGRRWSWKTGGWVEVPAGAAYAKWALVRRNDGKLFFASGAWKGADGGEVPAPEFLHASPSRPIAVVDPEGDTAPTAADLHVDGGADASTKREE
jgi:hypothetical protein